MATPQAKPFSGGAEANAPGWTVVDGEKRYTVWAPRPEREFPLSRGRVAKSPARVGWSACLNTEPANFDDLDDDEMLEVQRHDWFVRGDSMLDVVGKMPVPVVRAFTEVIGSFSADSVVQS